MLQRPKMIMFDYGNTLICEPGFSVIEGNKALLDTLLVDGGKNPNNVTAEDVVRLARELRSTLTDKIREAGGDYSFTQFNNLLFGLLQIEFDLPKDELERIFFDGVSSAKAMPNTQEMLSYLHKHRIRTAVISNNTFSGKAISERINMFFPNNNFEFIISSSDYLVRKPNPLIFEVALKKANLLPQEVWYCGDHVEADVLGPSSVGIFPVWYEDLSNTAEYTPEILQREREENTIEIKFEHLHINDWLELIDLIYKLNN